MRFRFAVRCHIVGRFDFTAHRTWFRLIPCIGTWEGARGVTGYTIDWLGLSIGYDKGERSG